MSDLREGRLRAVEVRRHHLVVHLVGCVGRSAIGLLFLFLIIATVEIGGAFVLVGTAMLSNCQYIKFSSGRGRSDGRRGRGRCGLTRARLTYWYRVMRSRMSEDEYS